MDANSMGLAKVVAVLTRLRNALPNLGVNGWHEVVAAIDVVIAALSQPAGEAVHCQYQHEVVVRGRSAATSSGIGCLSTGARCIPGCCTDCPAPRQPADKAEHPGVEAEAALNVLDLLRTGADGTKHDCIESRAGTMVNVSTLLPGGK